MPTEKSYQRMPFESRHHPAKSVNYRRRLRPVSFCCFFVMLPVAEDLDDSHLSDTCLLYRQAMTTVARRHGIPVIDGPKTFKDSGRSTGRLFLNQTLPSKAGHRTLGYALARRIKPWMRGRKILLQGTGEPLPSLPEIDSQPGQP